MTCGQIIGGRYRLGDRLGRGGMAEVRLGLDIRLGRGVAVKSLRTDLATNPEVRARFQIEARSAAGLSHPNIVRVFDIEEDVDPVSGASTSYLVLELVDGKTLAALLRTGSIFSQQQALRIAQQVLAALQHSHDSGIVHHDIKPGNVMLTGSGRVKVMDFGIAHNVVEAADSSLATATLGTPRYLSPERARGHTGDARSDLYSTGCLLYELLVGRPPFIGSSRAEIISQHLNEAPRRPSFYDPRLTSDLDLVVLRSLAKKPEDRYQTAQEMSAEISSLLAGAQAPVPATQAAPDVLAPTPEADQLIPERPKTVAAGHALGLRRPGRRRALVSSGLAAVLLSAGGLGIYATRAPGTSDTALTSAAILGLNPAEAQELSPEHQKAIPPAPPRRAAGHLPAADQQSRPVQAGVAQPADGSKTETTRSSSSQPTSLGRSTSTASPLSQQGAPATSATSAPAGTPVGPTRPTTDPNQPAAPAAPTTTAPPQPPARPTQPTTAPNQPAAPAAPTTTAPPRTPARPTQPTTDPHHTANPAPPTTTAPPSDSAPVPVAVPPPRSQSDRPAERPPRVHVKKSHKPVRSAGEKGKKGSAETDGSFETGKSTHSQHPDHPHGHGKFSAA